MTNIMYGFIHRTVEYFEKWEAYHILREMVERGISTAVPNQIHGDIPYSMMGAAV